jgi:hypothetical protein
VAVATIDTIVADVMLVAKLDWLLSLNPLAGIPGRAIELSRNPKQSHQNKHSAIDRQLCQRVCAVMKNLWHCRSLPKYLN